MALPSQACEAGRGTLHPSPAYRGVQHYSVLAFKNWGQDRGLITCCQTCWARTTHGDARLGTMHMRCNLTSLLSLIHPYQALERHIAHLLESREKANPSFYRWSIKDPERARYLLMPHSMMCFSQLFQVLER